MDEHTRNPDPSLKIIKRYSNRKLYDTEASCYVTLDDVTQMVKGGVMVKIVDHDSNEDLTRVVLVQIILEAERRKRHMPLGLLFELVKSASQPAEVASSSPSPAEPAFSERLTALEQKVKQLEQGKPSSMAEA